MKGFIQQMDCIEDPENYTDLMVCKSAAGFYIGTMYKDPELGGQLVPGSRDTGYYQTVGEAGQVLSGLENGTLDPNTILRKHP